MWARRVGTSFSDRPGKHAKLVPAHWRGSRKNTRAMRVVLYACLSGLIMLLLSRSVVSDSVRPHRRQPTRLCCPWDSPGKNTGVGCHFLQSQKLYGGQERGRVHHKEILKACLSNVLAHSDVFSPCHSSYWALWLFQIKLQVNPPLAKYRATQTCAQNLTGAPSAPKKDFYFSILSQVPCKHKTFVIWTKTKPIILS